MDLSAIARLTGNENVGLCGKMGLRVEVLKGLYPSDALQ
jgi:hypothetical protein